MYITINDVIGEKRIDLSYPICSNKEALEGPRSKEIAVIAMLSDNGSIEYTKTSYNHRFYFTRQEKLILSKTFASRALLSILERMIELTQFANDE